MNGIEAVQMLRRESENIDGWISEEDKYKSCELIAAARCYLLLAEAQIRGRDAAAQMMIRVAPKEWPMEKWEWTPSPIPKNNLRRAAALLVGEWDRIDRAGI